MREDVFELSWDDLERALAEPAFDDRARSRPVAPIAHATGRLHDGDLVEVDGTAGVVRVVEKS